MSARHAVFVHSPEMERYGYPEASPFKTNRAAMVRKTIHSMGLLSGDGRREVAPVKTTRPELERFHLAHYLDAIVAAERGELTPAGLAMGLGTADCPVFRGMMEYASLAAGATLTGARLILAGEAERVFNPSGGYHHAHPAMAAGFCYVNDIVLAAMELAGAGKRVLFLDLDVHHCDGVQDAFYERDDVMTISLHESGRTLFPGTGFENEIGRGKGRGYSVNIPLPVGTFDSAYRMAFDEVALPLILAYRPDVVMVEMGMDTLAGDPLAHLHLTNNVLADIVYEVQSIGVPILATGGGGYHVHHTVRGWSLIWSVLCDEPPDEAGLTLGGVMMESTEWAGGLRDRILRTDAGRRATIEREIRATIGRGRETVFPIHGL